MTVDHFYTLGPAVGQKEGCFVEIIKFGLCITADRGAGLMFETSVKLLFICGHQLINNAYCNIFCPAQSLRHFIMFRSYFFETKLKLYFIFVVVDYSSVTKYRKTVN